MAGLYAKLDVAFARDPDLMGHPLSRLAYIQWTCWCRENNTDGSCNAHVLNLVLSDITNPRRHMAFLVKIGKLEETPEGWRIPERIWKRWNLTKDEVNALTAAKSDAGTLGNHRRWHTTEPSPDCRFCIAPPSQNGSHKRSF